MANVFHELFRMFPAVSTVLEKVPRVFQAECLTKYFPTVGSIQSKPSAHRSTWRSRAGRICQHVTTEPARSASVQDLPRRAELPRRTGLRSDLPQRFKNAPEEVYNAPDAARSRPDRHQISQDSDPSSAKYSRNCIFLLILLENDSDRAGAALARSSIEQNLRKTPKKSRNPIFF